MDSDRAKFFTFTEPPTEADQVKCPACKTWSPFMTWQLGYDDCDTCGCVEVMMCPECERPISIHSGYSDPLKVAPLDPYAWIYKDAPQKAG